jgi:hypothetical protein
MGDEVGYVSAYDQNDLPDRVKLFVQDLWTATIGGERELGQMEYLYDTEYRNVSEDFFASSKWPSTGAPLLPLSVVHLSFSVSIRVVAPVVHPFASPFASAVVNLTPDS